MHDTNQGMDPAGREPRVRQRGGLWLNPLRWFRNSLSARFALLLTVTVLFTTAAMAILLAWRIEVDAAERTTLRAQELASMAAVSATALQGGSRADVVRVDAMMALNPDVVWFRVMAADGSLDHGLRSGFVPDALAPRLERVRASLGTKSSVLRTLVDGQLVVDVLQPVLRPGVQGSNFDASPDELIAGYVHLAMSSASLVARGERELAWAVGGALTLVLLVLLVTVPVTERMNRPLRDLARITNRLSSAQDPDFRQQVALTRRDEVGRLSAAFQRMLRRMESMRATLEDHQQNLERRVCERTEELEVARDQAEAASRAKSEFLANMSHEIRTPMNGVLGMCELLGNTELSARQQRFTGVIADSGKALLSVINQILDFSRIESGALELNLASFNLASFIEDTCYLLADAAQTKRLELICDVPQAANRMVIGDEARLRQVLINLVGNAIKFTEKGTVTLRVQIVDVADGRASFAFEVVDTGLGIPEAELGHIFDAFVQVDGSATRQFGGTGLGLAISRELVDLMGGELQVRSREGAGTTFHFMLSMLAKAPCNDADDRFLEGRRVLVVDDLEVNREILEHHLGEWGALVLQADCGMAALQVLQQEVVDLVVLDYHMPGMDGLELASHIRSRCAGAVPELVMLSSVTTLSELDLDAECQVGTLLTKPVKRGDLRLAVAGLLDGNLLQITRPKAQPTRTQLAGQHVLLVEDVAVNREVAQVMLEGLGCVVQTARNGREALQRLEDPDVPFALVLMDCQMPELDGYEATRRLRDREQTEGLARMPVIALTAHAMQGDREKCLAAGMDDYLSKPFAERDLVQVLGRWVVLPEQPDGSVAASAVPAPGDSGRDQLDAAPDLPDQLLDSDTLGGIRRLEAQSGRPVLERLVTMFAEEAGMRRTGLHAALADGDAAALRSHAHAFKSVAGNLGAARVFALCRDIEQSARQHQGAGGMDTLGNCGALLAHFDHECAAAHAALRNELGETVHAG